jgi:hypothetical protein
VTVRAVFWFCLGLYGPGEFFLILFFYPCYSIAGIVSNKGVGSVMMYSYMLKQRRKTLAK